MPLTDTAPHHRFAFLVPLFAFGLVGIYVVMRRSIPSMPAELAFVPSDVANAWHALVHGSSRSWHESATLAGSMVLHMLGASILVAGPLHLVSAVLYVWLFGDNVEGRLGIVRMSMLWVAGAVVAGVTHVWLHPREQLPVVGATGAIASLLGAYLVLFRRASVRFLRMVELPCWLFFASFFVLQIGPVQQAFGWVGVLDGIDVRAHFASLLVGAAAAPLLALGTKVPKAR
ncbi:MAG: rhomboid family intramembrane serine protease [Planctomycetes bacterium]|nr:rhomboid family intramembrane serine protease [Planctomycetota bacterium]